jgi:predicted DNA-binding ribbon-helix-helix protein
MALEEKQTVPQFINVLYDEILETHKDVSNFTSFLRVACAIYLHREGLVEKNTNSNRVMSEVTG